MGGLVGVVAIALLAACSAQLGDRGGDEGAPPERIGDVDYIEVFRNAHQFPNVARMCVEGLAFASTSSGGPSLMRMSEWDAWCAEVTGATAPATPTPPPSPTATPTPAPPTG